MIYDGKNKASYTRGTGSFPGVKRPGRGADHTPYLGQRLKKEWGHTSTSPVVLHRYISLRV